MLSQSRQLDVLFLLVTVGVVISTLGLLVSPYYQYTALPIMVLIGLIFLTVYPAIGLYTVVFLIPFGAYRAIGDVKIIWVLSLWLLIVMFGKLLFQPQYRNKLKLNSFFVLMLFFLVSFVSALLSEYKEVAIESLLKLAAAYLFIALNLFFFSEKKDFFHILPKVLIFSISIGSFLSVLSHFMGLRLFEDDNVETFRRAVGGTKDPNTLALIILFGLPFIFYWMHSTKSLLSKTIAAIFIIANIIAMYISYSRSGFLMMSLLLIILFYYYFLRNMKSNTISIVLAISILFMGGGIYYITTSDSAYVEHLQNISDTKRDKSIGRRYSYILVAKEAIIEAPILGHALGTFPEIYGKTRYTLQYERVGKTLKRYAHNTYLEVAVGTGILGLCIFLWLILKTIKNFWQAMKIFLMHNQIEQANLTYAYLTSFASICLYLSLYSDIYQKYLLLSIPLSQIALNFSSNFENKQL
jgi:O-antigen ligase